jgi:hypothetical protein
MIGHTGILGLVVAAMVSGPALAGEADVVDVKVSRAGDAVYDFDVTIRSNDSGWDHYADAFEVLAPDGTVLGQRILRHPHVEQQPFTRDLHGVKIPEGVDQVTIRARHKPKGYDGDTMTVTLPR